MSLQAVIPLAIATQAPQQGPYSVLAVPYYSNDESNWCWAACGEMMGALFLGRVIDQCTFAQAAFPSGNCCQDKDSCNSELQLYTDMMDKVFAVIGKTAAFNPQPISFAEVQEQIAVKQLPVQVGFRWNNGDGHVAVVCGVSSQQGETQVYVNDPVYGAGWIDFGNLQLAYGLGGSWQWTWTLEG
jgi:Papain-like cysteine protease AvrRpt2